MSTPTLKLVARIEKLEDWQQSQLLTSLIAEFVVGARHGNKRAKEVLGELVKEIELYEQKNNPLTAISE